MAIQKSPEDQAFAGNFPQARSKAFKRSKGICQACGCTKAEEAHHWALSYPSGTKVTEDDLVALCKSCHNIITLLRRLDGKGYSRSQLDAEINAASSYSDNWNALLDWVQNGKTGPENSVIQTLMTMTRMQAENDRLTLQNEMRQREEKISRRYSRTTWLIVLTIVGAALWNAFDIPAILVWLFAN